MSIEDEAKAAADEAAVKIEAEPEKVEKTVRGAARKVKAEVVTVPRAVGLHR